MKNYFSLIVLLLFFVITIPAYASNNHLFPKCLSFLGFNICFPERPKPQKPKPTPTIKSTPTPKDKPQKTIKPKSIKIHNADRAGKLEKDEIWSGQIRVIGDILVETGTTLTILPGTEVLVSANSDTNNLFGSFQCDGNDAYDMLKGIKQEDNYNCGVHKGEPYRDEANHISIIVNGTLKAIGTEDGKIIIKSNSPSPTIYDWNRLEIHNGILSYVRVDNYRILETKGNEVEISHSNLGPAGECGVCANSASKILFNGVSLAGHELIDMHNNSPVVSNNHIGPNPDKSCITIDGGSPRITSNIIEGCGSAVSLLIPPSDPKFEENLLKENTFLNNANNIWHNY